MKEGGAFVLTKAPPEAQKTDSSPRPERDAGLETDFLEQLANTGGILVSNSRRLRVYIMYILLWYHAVFSKNVIGMTM